MLNLLLKLLIVGSVEAVQSVDLVSTIKLLIVSTVYFV